MKPIAEETWMDFLEGNLPEVAAEALRQRIANEPEVAREWEALRESWDFMAGAEAVPEPSTQMDRNFEAMLAGYQQGQRSRPSMQERLNGLLGTWVVPRWAVSLLLILGGFVVGRLMGPSSGTTHELQSLTQEVQDMRSLMMLTLLEQPAAQDRMKAVSMTESLPAADGKVIRALVQTLHTDENVNVRMVAVEALARYGDQPLARMGLIEAIGKQDSPLVQVALADAMLELQASEAVPAFRELLQKPELDTTVQELVNETIEKLI